MALSRKERDAARAASEYLKAARVASKQEAQKKQAAKAASVRETLAKHRPILSMSGPVAPSIAGKAPKLLAASEYASAIDAMSEPHFRSPSSWVPRGKGRETLFRSLCAHVYAKYPTPPFLWSVFFEKDANTRARLVAVVKSVAAGNSFVEEVKTGRFTVPLTRKMCHEVLRSSADLKFLDAVRRVQIRTMGGNDLLWRAWIRTVPGRTLGTKADEEFWATVIHWLSQNPMLDRVQVGPLVDYIQFRRNEDANFSMKGRSAAAFFDAMLEWHGQLQRAKASAGQVFEPSGFKGAEFDNTRQGKDGPVVEIWRIKEVLTGKELAHEGRANKHCVYSYASSIEKKMTSIWSMTREDNTGNWHAITIEVRNATRSIVQARGTYNRPATGPESNAMHRWADMNKLTVSSYV